MRVSTSANCGAIMLAKTSATGKATLVICPTVSTKYRIRGKGAVATRAFCVVVNGLQCGATTTTSTTTPTVTAPTNTTNAITYTPAVVVSKVASMKKGKVVPFTTINRVTKVLVPAGAKISLTVAVTTKKICSISGTSVKALLPGTCSISVKVTPKASTKVKKPKTTTTKIKISITK